MKKTLWLALVLLIVCIFAFSACDNGDASSNNNGGNNQQTTQGNGDNNNGSENNNSDTPVVCQHTFGSWSTVKQATCKEEGKLVRTCSKCSETEESTISKTDIHTEVVDVAVSATCTVDGKTEGKHCSVCGKTIVAQTTVKATGHTEVVDPAIAATCKAEGKTEGKHCSECSAVLTAQESVSKSEHNYVNHICTKCGDESYTSTLVFELSDDNESYIVSGISNISEKNIVIPSKYNGKPVTAIGYEAFNECGIQSVVFGSNIELIHAWAFRACTQLTNIELPDKLTQIGEGAFAGCSGLTTVTMKDNVITLGKMAFYQCSNLKNITLSTALETIGIGAFADNYRLENITFPNALKKIDEQAFVGCTSLESITIPDNLEYIETYAFAECSALKEIIIGNSPLKICPQAFMECTSLTKLYIPGNVQYIDIQAFAYCTQLKEVIILNGLKTIGSAAFQGCNKISHMELPFIGHTATQDQFLGWIFGITTWYKDNASYVPTSLKTINFTGASMPYNALYGCDIEVTYYCAANSHTIIIDAAKEATCSATGLTEGSHCSKCNMIIIPQEVIESHYYIDNCCTICGEIKHSAVYQTFCNYIKDNATSYSGNMYYLNLGETQDRNYTYKRRAQYYAETGVASLWVDIYADGGYCFTVHITIPNADGYYNWRYEEGDAEVFGQFYASSLSANLNAMPISWTNVSAGDAEYISEEIGVFFVDYLISWLDSDFESAKLKAKNFGFSNY